VLTRAGFVVTGEVEVDGVRELRVRPGPDCRRGGFAD